MKITNVEKTVNLIKVTVKVEFDELDSKYKKEIEKFYKKNKSVKDFEKYATDKQINGDQFWIGFENDLKDKVQDFIFDTNDEIFDQIFIIRCLVMSVDYNEDKSYFVTLTYPLIPKVKVEKDFKTLVDKSVLNPIKLTLTKEMILKYIEVIIWDTRILRYQKKNKISEYGDELSIDYEAFIDGKPFEDNQAKDFELVLGKSEIGGEFDDQLLNHKAKDKFLVSIPIPDYLLDQGYDGDSLDIKVTINEVRQEIYRDETISYDEYMLFSGKENYDKHKANLRRWWKDWDGREALFFYSEALKRLPKNYMLPWRFVENDIELMVFQQSLNGNDEASERMAKLFVEMDAYTRILSFQYLDQYKSKLTDKDIDKKIKSLNDFNSVVYFDKPRPTNYYEIKKRGQFLLLMDYLWKEVK